MITGYGIDKIFKRIFDILTEKNQFYYDNEILTKFKKCKENINSCLNVKRKETEYEEYLKERNEIKKDITNTNELFKKYEGEENIFEKAKKMLKKKKKIYDFNNFKCTYSNSIY